jgi:1,4-dihydroxy-2-naphthoyl-CoA hydrolase
MADRRPSPFTKLIGLTFTHRAADRVDAELVVQDDVCNGRGVLHGGVMMAIGDAAGAQLTLANLAAGSHTATIESKTNFFAAVPKGETVHATATPLHRGRTTMVLETRITQNDGKLAAIVTQTQLIFPADGES